MHPKAGTRAVPGFFPDLMPVIMKINSLCCAVDPVTPKSFLYFHRHRNMLVHLRHVSTTTDRMLLFRQLSGKSVSDRLRIIKTYNHILSSDNCQSFLCMVNHSPVMLLEITAIDSNTGTPLGPKGNYQLGFVRLSPKFYQEKLFVALSVCLEYFWLFPEVGNMLIRTDFLNRNELSLLKKMGFADHGNMEHTWILQHKT